MNTKPTILEWKEHLKKQRESQISIEKYCREHGISHHTFRYHRGKELQGSNFKKKDFAPIFQEVSMQGFSHPVAKDSSSILHLKIQIEGWLSCEIRLG